MDTAPQFYLFCQLAKSGGRVLAETSAKEGVDGCLNGIGGIVVEQRGDFCVETGEEPETIASVLVLVLTGSRLVLDCGTDGTTKIERSLAYMLG